MQKKKRIFLLHFRVEVPSTQSKVRISEYNHYLAVVFFCRISIPTLIRVALDVESFGASFGMLSVKSIVVRTFRSACGFVINCRSLHGVGIAGRRSKVHVGQSGIALVCHKNIPLLRKYLIAATVALLLAGAGVTYYQMAPVRRQLAAQQQKSPVDDFLNSITDDEAKLLPYYEIEEIPEY